MVMRVCVKNSQIVCPFLSTAWKKCVLFALLISPSVNSRSKGLGVPLPLLQNFRNLCSEIMFHSDGL